MAEKCTCNNKDLATESSPAAGEEEEGACTCDASKDAAKECTCEHRKMMTDNKAEPPKSDAAPTTCKSHAMPHNLGDMELQEKLDAALAEVETLKKRATDAEAAIAAAEAAKVAAEIEAANAKKDAETEKLRADAAFEDLDAVKAKAVADHAKTVLEKARVDAAAEFQATLNDRVAERVELITLVEKLGLRNDRGESLNLAKMTAREIKVAAIKLVDGEEVPADKPDAFIDGVFSGALKRHARAAASRADVRQTINQMRQEPVVQLTGIEAEKAAKTAMMHKANKAWLTKVQE